MMPAMDSLDRRLDSLVDRMNRASGTQKVAAMAAVITELVAQRRLMHRHMQMMPEHQSQMMPDHQSQMMHGEGATKDTVVETAPCPDSGGRPSARC
jgi:hypothetical protein